MLRFSLIATKSYTAGFCAYKFEKVMQVFNDDDELSGKLTFITDATRAPLPLYSFDKQISISFPHPKPIVQLDNSSRPSPSGEGSIALKRQMKEDG
jgi:hypothetical protein